MFSLKYKYIAYGNEINKQKLLLELVSYPCDSHLQRKTTTSNSVSGKDIIRAVATMTVKRLIFIIKPGAEEYISINLVLSLLTV